MAKLGWVAFTLVGAILVGGATMGGSDDHVVQKLDELKAIASESLRIQRLDVHRRLFPAHRLTEKCDLDSVCQEKDAAFRASRAAAEAEAQKIPQPFVRPDSWLVGATEADFQAWVRKNESTVDPEVIRELKELRAKKPQGK